ncbi:hypothetical protein ANCCAN_10937 [Ancylostoma caninum]|uniref:ATP-dependent DNA helicase n=1 Tax=Ancylostoma caninum TaxID=29170 RepID=A0A368GFA6_ANCCA|nr:hypothetical protein ANCCAN_10937 [Ancylostoma caninum]
MIHLQGPQARFQQYFNMVDPFAQRGDGTDREVNSRPPEEHYGGGMEVRCYECGALSFRGECPVNRSRNGFNMCCNFGNVLIHRFNDFPAVLKSLLQDQTTAVGRHFKENIRQYNSALAMASMGANIDVPRGHGPYCFRIHGQVYHAAGPLHPNAGQRPMYAQVYVLDTKQAAEERMGHVANLSCNEELMNRLGELITQTSPYARSFKMMEEVVKKEEEDARREGRSAEPVRMVFDMESRKDPRRYNVPTANEVAVVFVGEDESAQATRSFAVHPRGGGLQMISDTDPHCDPLCYPLLFPTGEHGWHDGMRKRNAQGGHSRVTQREYYSHILQERGTFNPLHYAGSLFQQYVVDAYVRMEQNRLQWHRVNQSKLRAENYKALQDYMVGDEAMEGPPGRRIILPSSYPGSRRAQVQDYQDAMSIVSKYGKPDLFVTFTCNPKWREISENLKPNQTPSDRPDLVARVFRLKQEEMFEDLFKRHVLGEVSAWIAVYEWQKRGLPHVHMLITLKEQDKPRTAADVDRLVRAEIPDPVTQTRLYEIVTKTMLHRKCGATSPSAPCMRDGKCSKRFPMEFCEATEIPPDGYPKYRRPNNGRMVQMDGQTLDNAWVVPYNPFLTLKYNAHINVEICALIHAVKYLYKYVYKGVDKASLALLRSGITDRDGRVIDEIKLHLDLRYVCPPEAAHGIFGFSSKEKSDAVERLTVHLPDEQPVVFEAGQEEQALQRAADKHTALTAWFELNKRSGDVAEGRAIRENTFIDSRRFLYTEIPEHFTLTKTADKVWKPRKQRGSRVIGRMFVVSPQDPERTVRREDGQEVVCTTFMEAAKRRGLMRDDQHVTLTMQEATHFQMPAELRSLLAALLCFNEVSDPVQLWERFKGSLSEDYRNRGASEEESEAAAYYDIEERIARAGKNLRNFLPPPTVPPPQMNEVSFDPVECAHKGALLHATLNAQQERACNTILSSVSDPTRPRLFFIDGPGGSGKTYLYNALFNILIGQNNKVICTAWTGIAANLLPNGRTAASLFKLDIGNDLKTSSMRRQQKEARALAEVNVIIWDEASMIPRRALETVDELLRDIMQNEQPFGGKTMILGGDFRQVLPVVQRGNRSDTVNSCIKASALWSNFTTLELTSNMRVTSGDSEWINFLLRVGNGTENDEDGRVTLPTEIMCAGNIVTAVYGENIDARDTDNLSTKAILAPRNRSVDQLNTEVLSRMNSEERIYKSIDEAVTEDPSDAIHFQPEFLHKLDPSGMPPHELRLRKGAIVMLLRNLDVSAGLCNGTRLVVEQFGSHTLGCRFTCGNRKGRYVILPRIDNYSDRGLSFRLRRTQFPIRLAFSLSINKAQGQSFDRIGLCLPDDVFSHGQMYVALSRVRSKEGLSVQSPRSSLLNVVYEEVL